MRNPSEEKLNKLLQGAFPAQEVSPDFTLRLWRRLINEPVAALWKVPVPALALSILFGIAAGITSWSRGASTQADSEWTVLNRSERWDLFGNAPLDSLAGSYLRGTVQ